MASDDRIKLNRPTFLGTIWVNGPFGTRFSVHHSNHVLNQNKPLVEMPEQNGEKLNTQARHISRKALSQNRRSKNQMGNIKYGAKVPCNVKETILFDKANGDNLWKEAVKSTKCLQS